MCAPRHGRSPHGRRSRRAPTRRSASNPEIGPHGGSPDNTNALKVADELTRENGDDNVISESSRQLGRSAAYAIRRLQRDAPELAERVKRDVRTLCRALGYDINTVEFAIKDGVPYAIDFMNPAPDADLDSVGEFYHNWVTNAVGDLVFKRLAEPTPAPRYRWDALLNPLAPATLVSAVASAAEQAARTILPQHVRDIPGDIASGVTELIDNAAAVVSNLIGSEPAKPKTPRRPRSVAPSGKPKTNSKRTPKTRATEPPTEA